MRILCLSIAVLAGSLAAQAAPVSPSELAPTAAAVDFVRDIAPIFHARCLKCHGPDKQSSGYRLDHKQIALTRGDEHAPNIVPGHSADSPLVRFVAGLDAEIVMPPKGERLTAAEVALLRRWIDGGADWPDAASVELADPLDWWSLRPLARPPLPAGALRPEQAIDAFLDQQLAARGLAMSPAADARTLCRRIFVDLTGLPPTPEQIDAYVADPSIDKFERLVDRLLASPHYGERWARNWLDVVHYGDTHGYDKDQPRPHAWPYRDYVIRALNGDKPYARFVQEQVAGDVLFPGTRDGIEALGFLAAGPWDLIGHAEVTEDKIDGKFARHFDRDDMVGNTIGTFASLTVQCAQCHDHKFDPVTQADYYSLQAVFAAVDRADKPYDLDPAIAAERARLQGEQRELAAADLALQQDLVERGGRRLAALTTAIQAAEQSAAAGVRPEYGWHSGIAASADVEKWVQVDLGVAVAIDRVVLAGASDDFQGIGAGFGFPVRFRIEASEDAVFGDSGDPKSGGARTAIAAHEHTDYANPGTMPQVFPATGVRARYVRVTATRLALRNDDYIAALAELQVFDAAGDNVALGAPVTSGDSIEAPVRWARQNLTDGIYPAARGDGERLATLREQREALLAELLDEPARRARTEHAEAMVANREALAALPAPELVYAATVHTGTGAFCGTGAQGGKPRPIFLLRRGQVTQPGPERQPAAIAALEPLLPARFVLADDAAEGQRRAALAAWLTDPRNPLVWRSIVNRVWQYHFGRGLVDTPNDFGRMGALPTHPELLDWLAITFREDLGGSLKALHRLIVTSAAYRQSSSIANERALGCDNGNALLWRANARKLEAEAVRDAVLSVSGTLDLTAGGPGWQDFVVEHPEHSPHYRYDLADPDDPRTWRRSIYRFIVRSQMQPFLTSLDCADPSQRVDKRNECVSPGQALTLLNNAFLLAQAKHFAARVAAEAGSDPAAQIVRAFRLATGRTPTAVELQPLVAYAAQHGMANVCRLLLNLNEFTFLD
jgi:mono/diheme cytochrome c family protein